MIQKLKEGKDGLCSGCFKSHFPKPNMKICKLKMQSRKQSFWPFRLTGGGGYGNDDQISIEQYLENLKDSTSPMINRAMENAEFHGIHLHHGVSNMANGNCAFESIIDSISTRTCFRESFDGTPDYWRNVWMTTIENIAFEDWHGNMSLEEWEAEFKLLKQSGTYEVSLGDLIIPGIAHCTRKNILIFNTSAQAHSPIYVVTASTFGEHADTEIPVCLAYDQSHYESLVPNSEEDINKTVVLSNKYLNGEYDFKMEDVPIFKKQEINLKSKYDEDFPVISSINKKISVTAFIKSPQRMKDLPQVNNSPNQKENIESMRTKNVNKKEYSFQNSLPVHLKNKRPRDMISDEKKEYTNLQRKFSRGYETEEAANIRKEKVAKYNDKRKTESEEAAKIRKKKDAKLHAERISQKSEAAAKIRKENNAKVQAERISKESEEAAKIRKDNDAKVHAEKISKE